MSFDAVTWAKAQTAPTPRAKAVLICLAAYADGDGVAWAPVSILSIETSLKERTVQRGLAECKAAGLIELTGDNHVRDGRLFPLYRFALDRGPQNTRDRLRLARAAAALGVSPVTPDPGAEGPRGDTHDTPWGVTGDAGGVTPETPKQEGERIYNPNPQVCAREAASRLRELEALAPASILRFYDQALAMAAMLQLLGEGLACLDALPDAMRRMRAHPVFRSRKHPPQLHEWLRKRAFLGWLEDDEADARRTATPAAKAREPGSHPLRDELADADEAAAQCFDRAAFDEAAGTLTPATSWAANRLAQHAEIFERHGVALTFEGAHV